MSLELITIDDDNDFGLNQDSFVDMDPSFSGGLLGNYVPSNIDKDVDAASEGSKDPEGTPGDEQATDPDVDEVISDADVAQEFDTSNFQDADRATWNFLQISVPEKISKEEAVSHAHAIDEVRQMALADDMFVEDSQLESMIYQDPVAAVETFVRNQYRLDSPEEIEERIARAIVFDESGKGALNENGKYILRENIQKPLMARLSNSANRFKQAYESSFKKSLESRKEIIEKGKNFAVKEFNKVGEYEIGEVKVPKEHKLKLINAIRDNQFPGNTAEEKLSNAAFTIPEIRSYIIEQVVKRAAQAAQSKILKR